MIKDKVAAIFWKGLLTILPLYLTFYFIYWLLSSVEKNIGGLLEKIMGNWYYPGFGLLATIVLVFIIGILMQVYITQYLVSLFDRLVKKIPLISDLYTSIKSFTSYFSSNNDIEGKEVVMVSLYGIELLGLVTRSDFSKAPTGIVQERKTVISVYIPMSYQVGGFTVYLTKDNIRSVDMSPKAALKWALMGGIED